MSSRVPTPSGRVETTLGNPPGRQVGPTQHLIPVGPPPTYAGVPITELTSISMPELHGQIRQFPVPRATPTAPIQVIGFPRLDSPLIGNAGQTGIPWTQLLSNLWRLAQPTGIVPGTYAGIIFNAFGQAISASTSGASFDNPTLNSPTLNDPTLTGHATAPTPPANDNSTSIATTAWVREQNYATEAFVGSQGFVTLTQLNAMGFATEAWVLSQGFIHDAPADGNVYGRQNGQWVVVTPSGGT